MNRGKQHIDEELLIRFLQQQSTEQETARIKKWLNASEENRNEFEKLEKLWKITEDPADIAPAEVDVNKAWGQLRSRMNPNAEMPSKHRAMERSLAFYITRAAAVLVIGIIFYVVLKNQLNPQTTLLTSVDTAMINNKLPDGSIIALNQNTTIEYQEEFSDKERKVKLKGEAFFDVEADESRPFIIEAQDAIITVLGTSFNVKALDEDIAVEVLVEEGLVELANPDRSQSIKLEIGEKGIYIKRSKEVKRETDLDPEALFWLNKTLLFRDTELSVVFQTLEKTYDVNIEINNEGINRCLLTAKFSNETIENIVDHIATIFELETKKDGKDIVISGNGCP